MAPTPDTQYARSEAGYVAFQVFGNGPPAIMFITSWAQNLDVMWDEPGLARYMGRLASFSQVVCFDKRGSGVSDPVPWNTLPALEDWMDDARIVLDAVGVEQTAVIGDVEGGPMAILFAATYPERVSALVLINTFARWRRDTDYPIGMPAGTVDKLTELYEEHWGIDADILQLTAPTATRDPRFRDWYRRYQRLAMPRGAAAEGYRWVTNLDVRMALSAIQAPTLVVTRADARHHRPTFGRYLADHISGATYVELAGADTYPFQAGDFDVVLDEVEQFLTGAKPTPAVDRVLGTILFTDIVASTETAAVLGDTAWVALRQTHDDLVRESLRLHRGREMKHTGDGFLALFDGPARAVACADRIRQQLGSIGLEVRQGLHTGEVQLVGDDIGGVAVHLANRIMAEAEPGTILTSSTVKDLVFGSRIEFLERGRRELKGVPDPWNLFQVIAVP